MRFTEHELTAALTGAAKSVVASGKKFRKGGADIDEVWDEMDRYERFQLLDALGGQILPVLVALPDVDVAPGTRPSYSARQVSETVTGLVGDDVGKLRRAVADQGPHRPGAGGARRRAAAPRSDALSPGHRALPSSWLNAWPRSIRLLRRGGHCIDVRAPQYQRTSVLSSWMPTVAGAGT